MGILIGIITAFWFLLPAAFANMAPVFFKKVNIINYPIDFGLNIGKKRLLGENKTWRGLFFGVIFAIIIVYLQSLLYSHMIAYSLLDYAKVNIILLGILLGFGALFGDLVKSFFKRRFSKKAGESWPPFDQIDWIIGALLFASFYVNISLAIWIISLVMFAVLHPIVNYIGYLLRIKKNKF